MGTQRVTRRISVFLTIVLACAASVFAAQRGPVTSAVDPELEKFGKHNLDVGKQYFKKKAWAGARGRLEEVAGAYPEFTKIDEVYFLLGICYVKTGDAETARKMFVKLLDERPDSSFAAKAREELEKLEKG